MALFEFDAGRLIPAQFGTPLESGLTAEVMASLRLQVLDVIDRPLFPVAWANTEGDQQPDGGPHSLTALDPSGQVVLVELMARLDPVSLIAALSRLGQVSGQGWMDLAQRYPGGADAFQLGWAEFREVMPTSSAAGPRLILVIGEIDSSITPALGLLCQSGVELHQATTRKMSNGRRFLEVQVLSPISLQLTRPQLTRGRGQAQLAASSVASAAEADGSSSSASVTSPPPVTSTPTASPDQIPASFSPVASPVPMPAPNLADNSKLTENTSASSATSPIPQRAVPVSQAKPVAKPVTTQVKVSGTGSSGNASNGKTRRIVRHRVVPPLNIPQRQREARSSRIPQTGSIPTSNSLKTSSVAANPVVSSPVTTSPVTANPAVTAPSMRNSTIPGNNAPMAMPVSTPPAAPASSSSRPVRYEQLGRNATGLAAIAAVLGLETVLLWQSPTGQIVEGLLLQDGQVEVGQGQKTNDLVKAFLLAGGQPDRYNPWQVWCLGNLQGPSLAEALNEVNREIEREARRRNQS